MSFHFLRNLTSSQTAGRSNSLTIPVHNILRKIPPQLWAVLLLGAVSQIGQVLLLRELLMIFHGNELTLGVILAFWLLWVGIGSKLVVTLLHFLPKPVFLLKVNTVAIALVLLLTILFIRVLRGFFDVLPGTYLALPDIILSCFLVMAPFCLMLGAQFVLLARIWRESIRTSDTSGAEKTYVGEAAGNMLGGVVFTFIMVHHLNSFQAALLASLLMIFTVWYLIRTGTTLLNTTNPRYLLSLLSLLLIFMIVFPLLDYVDNWAYRVQWNYFAPQYELLETRQSKHGNISVVRYQDQYSFFQSGHLIFSTAGDETRIPGLEEQEAVDFAHLAMVQHQNPQQVLLIGGGLSGTLSEMLKHPLERVDYIELDQELTIAARKHISEKAREALDDPRVNLIHGDGRLFTKTADTKYDLIIIDVPDPFTAELNRYYTKDFFQEAKELLDEQGVLVTSTTSTPDLRGTAIANRNTTIFHTLRKVFPQVLPAGDQSLFYFAGKDRSQVAVDASSLEERYQQRNIPSEEFSSQRYYTLLEKSQLRRVNWVLRNHGRAPKAHLTGPPGVPPLPGSIAEQEMEEKELSPVSDLHFVNSDLQPIGYYYTLTFWEGLTRTDHHFSLQNFLRVESWWILPLAAIPLLATLALSKAPSRRFSQPHMHFAVLFTVFSTGFSTMALQIALLFSFQGIYGFVYETIGLITGMFMCGLSLGAYLTHRYVKDKGNIYTLAKVQLFMALWAALIALVLPQAAAVKLPNLIFVLFSVLTFTAGLINGIDFPLTVSCYQSLVNHADKSTGTVYGVELVGACLGASLASVLIAPILGIKACFLLASIASGSAFIVLLMVRR